MQRYSCEVYPEKTDFETEPSENMQEKVSGEVG
jgi:hypothetical protein